ncbi:MAG: class I SAM-dependent methyltransferase [Bacteroidales bacterium]|nr:class I SAM-dependent methyltransferase [Bacteroidales bacterium]
MEGFKFDPAKLEHLNDPQRLKDIPPGVIWKPLAVDRPETVIDLGAGTGFFSVRFAEMKGVKKVYALDISEAMIEYIHREVSPLHPRIEPVQMEESVIPLPDDIADVLVMINLHHEFHDPHALLKECARVLKPEGRLAVVDWKKKDTAHGPPVSKRYREDEVIKQLETVPFSSIRTHQELPNHFLIVAENMAYKS